ncbi:PREDICTED: uncharacterized protein LOC105580708 isoform X4 [Cercocebus atys]|uniref:uncharacterized protein LOC105580708 isoform X4 n=1 Tax=Cercocebus atys TaxID=9531 RepID=UPI0005F411C7|nr:PREDICTED: uncharacterized protein LOC105580708 isoform X4 [Cercocebus atys]
MFLAIDQMLSKLRKYSWKLLGALRLLLFIHSFSLQSGALLFLERRSYLLQVPNHRCWLWFSPQPKVACPPPPCPLISSLGGPLLILNTRVCVPVILGREGSGTIGWRNAFGTVQQFPTSNRPRSGTQGEPDDPARCQVLPGDWLAESTCISGKVCQIRDHSVPALGSREAEKLCCDYQT